MSIRRNIPTGKNNYNAATGCKAVFNQREEKHGCVYGWLPGRLGSRVLGIVAGRTGIKLEEIGTFRTREVHMTQEESLDMVVALSSRAHVQVLGLYNVCDGRTFSHYLPNDPSVMESFATKIIQGFTTE